MVALSASIEAEAFKETDQARKEMLLAWSGRVKEFEGKIARLKGVERQFELGKRIAAEKGVQKERLMHELGFQDTPGQVWLANRVIVQEQRLRDAGIEVEGAPQAWQREVAARIAAGQAALAAATEPIAIMPSGGTGVHNG